MTGRSRDDLADRRGLERNVYQPAEDSGLLATAIKEHGRGRLLEVGTGSGWVAERAVQAADGVTDVVASDYSPYACRAARRRARGEAEAPAGNGERRTTEDPPADGAAPGFAVVRGDLVAPFADSTFETVAFNPPYLPTDPENEWDDWMERALSGGESGRALIEPFLDTVGRVLAPGGVVLLLVSSLAGYDAVLAYAESCGFDTEVIVEESFPFETLSVVALTRFSAE